MHSVIVQKRRKRSINFTEADRQVLLNLVQPHLAVIENRRMDKFTSKLKSETWENIKTQYNRLNTEPRTALQLKLFYEANKYRMRRESNKTTDSSATDENSDDKIVKIELETSTILDALAQTEAEEKRAADAKSTKAKIKCVEIEKLKDVKCDENSSQSTPPLQTGINAALAGSAVLQPDNPKSQIVPNTTICSFTPQIDSPPSNKQDELHAMRMKILEDERYFRRQEHLKHMEYFEIGIMALKAFLLKQAAQPLSQSMVNQK